MSKQINGLGLFSGAGGFELGFTEAGINLVAQCDLYEPQDIPTLVADHEDKLKSTTTKKEAKKVKSDWRKSIKYGSDLRQLSERHWPNTQRINGVQNVKKETITKTIDVIFGGFPCQDISIAGLRAGLAGDRSGLWFEFLRVVKELKPEWVVIENVSGLLSSNGGRDLVAIFSGLEECGYWWAYRTFDSQYAGVPQRRRRVFIVASLTKGCSQEVLFERSSSPWDSPPSREEGEGNPKTFTVCSGKEGEGKGYLGQGEYKNALSDGRANGGDCGGGEGLVAFDTTQITSPTNRSNPQPGDPCHPLTREGHPPTIAATLRSGDPGQKRGENIFAVSNCNGKSSEVYETLRADSHGAVPMIAATLSTKNEVASSGPQRDKWYNQSAEMFEAVRRLTPLECERLQGFPDNFTEGFSDSTRYKMMGNAVTVNVAEWIGRQLLEMGMF